MCFPMSPPGSGRSEEHTSELQSHVNLVCRLLLECYGDHRDLHSFPTRRSSDLYRTAMRSLVILLVALSVVSPVAAEPEPDLTIDAATRGKVIEGSLAALTRYYVFPDVATRIGEIGRAHV